MRWAKTVVERASSLVRSLHQSRYNLWIDGAFEDVILRSETGFEATGELL